MLLEFWPMAPEKRVPMSIRISERLRDALLAKAQREGHRYPAAFAAHLLECAVMGQVGVLIPALGISEEDLEDMREALGDAPKGNNSAKVKALLDFYDAVVAQKGGVEHG